MFKDDALIELASTKPLSEADLAKSRLLLRDARRGEIANGILSAVKAGVEAKDLPKPAPDEPGRPGNAALAELLRVLLKAKADAAGVAPRLIASASDLDAIASGMRPLANDKVLADALKTLRGKAKIKRTMWSRRAQEYEAKINSGDLISIAEVVRDLYRHEDQPEPSYSERQLYESALDRMVREVAAVEKVDREKALEILSSSLQKKAA